MMKAKDIQPGDVFGESLMVRDVSYFDEEVTLLLSQGRTDPGKWSQPYPADQELDVTRVDHIRH